MKQPTEDINAVHENDLQRLLDKVGLLELFTQGKVKCKFCQEPVSFQNIYSLIVDSGSYKLICDQASCVASLMEYLEDKNKKKINEY